MYISYLLHPYCTNYEKIPDLFTTAIAICPGAG